MAETEPAEQPVASDLMEAAAARLREGVALLEAIDANGLLNILPAASEAGQRQQRAVSLLSVLRRELEAVVSDLESASCVNAVIAKITDRDETKGAPRGR